MKKLLLAGTILASVSGYEGYGEIAYAQDAGCTVIGGITYCDPTAFHVSGNQASGSDPVLLNQDTEFKIIDNSGANIDVPLVVYFAEPKGSAAPTISSVNFNGGTPDTGPFTITSVGNWALTGNPKDLYTFVGCLACDNSINQTNIKDVFALENLTVPTSLDVYSVTIQQGFANKDDFEEFIGSFALGTIIAPWAENVGDKKVTIFDTSWTNAGFVDANPVINPTGGGAPEPSTWLMIIAGFGLMGALGVKRSRRERLAHL